MILHMANQIQDELTDQAVRSVPMDDIVTAGTGGYDSKYVILRCNVCSWYGDKVAPPVGRFESRPVSGHIVRLTPPVPVADLNQAAGRHACPPEVTAAAKEARAARGGATVTAPSGSA